MIVMRLCGGLGNQMFQYALGRRLAHDKAAPLWLDLSPFGLGAAPGDTPRSYRLDHFNIQARPAPFWMGALLPFPRRLPRILSRLPRWPGVVKSVTEKSDAFDPAILSCPNNTYLNGYWQTEKYFADIADIIRADFALVAPMTPARQSVADQMGDNAVSLHVRRGDYVTNKSASAFHGTCSPEWYAQAVERLKQQVPDPHFFVFSDDPAWARANLALPGDSVFVDPQPDGREYEDLHLMARCRHHIIANSSYSWWGAWLNPSPAKKVIAPARWFRDAPAGDRIPDSWITV